VGLSCLRKGKLQAVSYHPADELGLYKDLLLFTEDTLQRCAAIIGTAQEQF
jgi:hypothetical protein